MGKAQIELKEASLHKICIDSQGLSSAPTLFHILWVLDCGFSKGQSYGIGSIDLHQETTCVLVPTTFPLE